MRHAKPLDERYPEEEGSFLPPISQSQPPSSKPSLIQAFVSIIILVVSFPLRLLATIMNNFTEPGGLGAITLGSLVFVFGVFLSADTYWQTLFGGVPLFPYFETRWLGWDWFPQVERWFPLKVNPGIFFNGTFILSIAISFVLQALQSFTIRNATLNPVSVRGVHKKTVGLIAIACWTFDLIMAFYSHNPMAYSNPGDVGRCFMYNIFTIFAAELGYITYKILRAV